MAGVSVHFVQFCIQWSSVALLYYDYILTFGMEVRYVWMERFRFSTILYICCRYALVANIVYLLTIANKITGKVYLSLELLRNFTHIVSHCHSGYIVSSALSVAGRAAVVIVWTGRTFAVYGRNLLILLFIGSIGLTVVILDTYEVAATSCKGSSTAPTVSVGGVLAIMMCVFEIFSFGLTTFRTIQAITINGNWRKQKKGINHLILEQGALYFCVVTVLTISSLALNLAIPGGFLQRLLNAYTVPLSGFMTARFLLHIRKWEGKHIAFRSSGGGGGGEDEARTSTGLDFESPQNMSRGSQSVSRSGSETDTSNPRFMDDFGEDPVRRAKAQATAGNNAAYDNLIVEEPRA